MGYKKTIESFVRKAENAGSQKLYPYSTILHNPVKGNPTI